MINSLNEPQKENSVQEKWQWFLVGFENFPNHREAFLTGVIA